MNSSLDMERMQELHRFFESFSGERVERSFERKYHLEKCNRCLLRCVVFVRGNPNEWYGRVVGMERGYEEIIPKRDEQAAQVSGLTGIFAI